jgi:integrase
MPPARARLPKPLRFHDLRHTCAALLIVKGSAYGGDERSSRAPVDSGHIRSAHLFPRNPQELADWLDEPYRNAASAGGADVRPLRP